MRNARQPLAFSEQVQVQRLIRDLGEATAARSLDVSVFALRRAADGVALNQKTRDLVRLSGWVVPAAP
jgi:hypothetical protein